jgi:Zn-dependent peptidase ImmA (M78 family)
MEREANYFARCLLMPRRFVLADLKATGGVDLCEDDQVKQLAKKYGVSVSLMALRIYEVNNGVD